MCIEGKFPLNGYFNSYVVINMCEISDRKWRNKDK